MPRSTWNVLADEGQLSSAYEMHERALELARRIGAQKDIAGALINLGTGFRALFPTPGTYDIGVRVSDNTALTAIQHPLNTVIDGGKYVVNFGTGGTRSPPAYDCISRYPHGGEGWNCCRRAGRPFHARRFHDRL